LLLIRQLHTVQSVRVKPRPHWRLYVWL